jgi:Domain of unknown function (DUF2703)
MKIELLYFAGCPNHEATLRLVREILLQEGLEAEVSEIRIDDTDEIHKTAFPGSPTVRINGRDIEEDIGLAVVGKTCRMYRENRVMHKLPGRALVIRALREAAEHKE